MSAGGGGGGGGYVKPSDAKNNESPEQYIARKKAEEAEEKEEAHKGEEVIKGVAGQAEVQLKHISEAPSARATETRFVNRQKEIISSLRMLQPDKASLFSRGGTALDKWKEPAVEIAFDCAGLTMFGDLREMSMEKMKNDMGWVFNISGMKRGRGVEELTDEQKRLKFIDCVEALLKQTLAEGIYATTAIPRAIFQLGFDNNPGAVVGAIGANFLLRWAGWKLLTSIGEQLIGAISFRGLTLSDVVGLFQEVLNSPKESINAALGSLLNQFGVPEELRAAYIAAVASYAYDQIQLGISTIAVTSISIAFGTQLLPFHNQVVDAAGNLVNENLAPGGVLERVLGQQAAHQGPLGDADNFTLELSRHLKRAFALVCNISTSLASQSILAMYATVFFVRSPPGTGGFDRLISIVGRGSGAAGGVLVDAAKRASPANNPQYEAVRFVFGCINLNLNRDDGENLARVAVFQSSTTSRMIKILNEALKSKNDNLPFNRLFLKDDCATYLLALIKTDTQRQLNMENLMGLFQNLGLLESGLTREAIDELSENFKSFSSKSSVNHTPTESSQLIRQQIINETGNEILEEAVNVFKSAAGTLHGKVFPSVAVAFGQSEETVTPAKVSERQKLVNKLVKHASNIPAIFDVNLTWQVESGAMSLQEAEASRAEFGPQMNECSTQLVKAYTTHLATTSAIDVTEFVTNTQLALKETSNSLVTKSKQTVIAACGACINFAAESAIILRRAGSTGMSWVKGFFRCVAPAVPEDQFERVVAAAGGGGGSDTDAAGAAAAAAAAVADVVNPDTAAQQLEMAAIAQSEMNKAEGGADGTGEGNESSDMAKDGGRSRSRKRSASKRTRRKGVAKKQKSNKNKRKSRRYVRRASSRKSRK